MAYKVLAVLLSALHAVSSYAGLGSEIPQTTCSEQEKEEAREYVLGSEVDLLEYQYRFSIFVLFECNARRHEGVKIFWLSETIAGRNGELMYPPAYMHIEAADGTYQLDDFSLEVSIQSGRITHVGEKK